MCTDHALFIVFRVLLRVVDHPLDGQPQEVRLEVFILVQRRQCLPVCKDEIATSASTQVLPSHHPYACEGETLMMHTQQSGGTPHRLK
jgi:hypothetical protein